MKTSDCVHTWCGGFLSSKCSFSPHLLHLLWSAQRQPFKSLCGLLTLACLCTQTFHGCFPLHCIFFQHQRNLMLSISPSYLAHMITGSGADALLLLLATSWNHAGGPRLYCPTYCKMWEQKDGLWFQTPYGPSRQMRGARNLREQCKRKSPSIINH